MGQYYQAVVIKNNEISTYDPHTCKIGLRLAEHAYIRNRFTEKIAHLLYKNPAQIVWMGEYANNLIDDVQADRKMIYQAAWGEDSKSMKPVVRGRFTAENRFLLNHTKKQFFDCSDLSKDSWGYTPHPLPLLCCCGNGCGGGDYFGSNMDKIGSWAFDLVSVDDHVPYDFEDVTASFVADW